MTQNLILLITGIIGFLTAGLILKNHKFNSVVNVYFILIIITFSFRYFLTGLAYFTTDESLKLYYLRYSNSALIVIPLIYLYFKQLFKSEKAVEKKELLHFIFPIFFFVFKINLDFFKINNRTTVYILFALLFFYVIYYIFLCYRVLQQNIWKKKGFVKIAKKQSILKNKWIYFLFLATSFIGIRFLGSMIFDLNFRNGMINCSFQWISALVWLLVLFRILVTPELLYGYDVLREKNYENRNENLILNSIWDVDPKIQIKNAQHLLLKEKIEPKILLYIEKIEKITISDHIFRDSNIAMVDMANKLNIPKSHISYLFKYHSTISFSDYKKAIRIQDAIKLINDDFLKETTLDYLSKKVGFPSYNTFFTSFKEIAGVSPQEYNKNCIEEIAL